MKMKDLKQTEKNSLYFCREIKYSVIKTKYYYRYLARAALVTRVSRVVVPFLYSVEWTGNTWKMNWKESGSGLALI
jgi:hypothetical protein